MGPQESSLAVMGLAYWSFFVHGHGTAGHPIAIMGPHGSLWVYITELLLSPRTDDFLQSAELFQTV